MFSVAGFNEAKVAGPVTCEADRGLAFIFLIFSCSVRAKKVTAIIT